MFTTTAFLDVEGQYRREQLRRAWGGPLLVRLRRRQTVVPGPGRRHASVTGERAVLGAR